MRLIEYFDKIYVINLPHRIDKKKYINQQLVQLGSREFQDKIEIFSAIRPLEAAGFPSIGVRGCFLSHLGILRKASQAKLKNYLIAEDVLKISRKLLESETLLVEQLKQKTWDFVYFGHQINTNSKGEYAVSFEYYSEGIRLSHFYGINSSIYEKFICFLETVEQRPPGHPEGGPMHFDGACSTFRRQNKSVKTLIACPSLGKQESFESDLHPSAINKGFMRPIISLIRFLKRSFST